MKSQMSKVPWVGSGRGSIRTQVNITQPDCPSPSPATPLSTPPPPAKAISQVMGIRDVYDTLVFFCLHCPQHFKSFWELPYRPGDIFCTVFWNYEVFSLMLGIGRKKTKPILPRILFPFPKAGIKQSPAGFHHYNDYKPTIYRKFITRYCSNLWYFPWYMV